MLQLILDGVNFDDIKPASSETPHPRLQAAVVLKEAPRLVKCLLELALERKDATSTRSALDLLRSLSAKAWFDSPFVLRQIPKLGDKSVGAR